MPINQSIEERYENVCVDFVFTDVNVYFDVNAFIATFEIFPVVLEYITNVNIFLADIQQSVVKITN